jgi:hypothetical protein
MHPQHSQICRLAAHVHACSVNGDLVFLSIERGSYLCLPGGECLGHLSNDRRELTVHDGDLAAELTVAGLVRPSDEAAPTAPRPERRGGVLAPARTALRDSYEPPDIRDLGAMTQSLVDVLSGYRGQSFAQVLANSAPLPEPPQVTNGLLQLVDDFHRWAPFAPTSAKCLLRAFMLLRLLRRHGEDALWIFGVRTWPFHAHCWLQCEDMVLDDYPERIGAFTPILVL